MSRTWRGQRRAFGRRSHRQHPDDRLPTWPRPLRSQPPAAPKPTARDLLLAFIDRRAERQEGQ